jgi:hypothetical protein
MVLAAHQPNYLPWAGFFQKMARCDVFVLLDSVQYARRSYTARCLIKQSDGRRHWLSLPVRKTGRYYQSIAEVEIDNTRPWRHDHLRTLESNYARAPYFRKHRELLDLAYGRKWENLCQMNLTLIEHMAKLLGIGPRLIRLSDLGIKGQATGLLVSLCRTMGADTYLSGPSGGKYLEAEKFKEAGIKLEIFRYWPAPYPQLWGGFVPGLSVIDLLFNCGPQAAGKELGLAP